MGEKILIAEDDRINRNLIINILKIKDYDVIVAKNGKEAVDLCQSQRPDLIIMDIQMPVMGGLEATRIIKSNQEIADIPVLALTALAMKGDEEKIRYAGCDDYITKPVDIETILNKVEKYLRKGKEQ